MTFAAELKRAMTERGITTAELARQSGRHRDTINHVRCGQKKPAHTFAVAVAEALMWDNLVTISLEMHSAACIVCGAPFIRDNQHRKYCSKNCRSAQWARRPERVTEQRLRRDAAENRLRRYQDAVAAFCMSCEPEGLCRDAGCALRELSPLPLVRVRAA